MTCDKSLVEKYFNNELPQKEDNAVFDHIMACRACGDYFATLSAINDHKMEISLAYQQILAQRAGERKTVWEVFISWIRANRKLNFALQGSMAMAVIVIFALVMLNNDSSQNIKLARQIENGLDYYELAPVTRGTVDVSASQSVLLLKDKNYAKALQTLDDISKMSGSESDLVHLLKGLVYFNEWRDTKSPDELPQNSISHLKRVLEGTNNQYKEYACLTLAQIYLAKGNTTRAQSFLLAGKRLEQDHFPLIVKILSEFN